MREIYFLLAAVVGQAATPVVVELFTSEGCSSCPPADELLIRLEQRQPVPGAQVIALSLHVDYWNQLGWTDPFSSHEFSNRQRQYSTRIRDSGVYTPQMVIDGRQEFVGSDARRAQAAIANAARAPKASLRAGCEINGKLLVHLDSLPAGSDRADLLLAITEGGLTSPVSRGEN
ncbi:MAG: DUF1223 domain-containing protein, partial [Bryobacteraceae bacterium]